MNQARLLVCFAFLSSLLGPFAQAGDALVLPKPISGMNFWGAAYLGRETQDGGDRARLQMELDQLQSIGVSVIRVMALTEGPDAEPWRIAPSIQPSPGVFQDEILKGLDFLMSELELRNMRAILCLNNFWHWSGGMAQYLKWAGESEIPYPPPHPGGDWNHYQQYTSQFYSHPIALGLAREAMKRVILRTNSLTGRPYREDPSIFAWELANEPRGIRNRLAYLNWIQETAAWIKKLSPYLPVTTGSEGLTSNPKNSGINFVEDHSFSDIDFATLHIWPENWGWYDPNAPETTFEESVENTLLQIREAQRLSRNLDKPWLLEEFGLARDGRGYDPNQSGTSYRDIYFQRVIAAFREESQNTHNNWMGIAFWAWGGEARPPQPGGFWKAGDPLIGDPPHEHQGWYSIFSNDQSTLDLIRDFLSI